MFTSLIIGIAKSKVLLGSAVITGAIGVTKGIKGTRDLIKADRAYKKLIKSINKSQKQLNIKQDIILENVEKLDKIKIKTYENEIKDILRIYSEIKNINEKEKELHSIKDVPLESINISIRDTKKLSLNNSYNKKVRTIGTVGLGVAIGSLLNDKEKKENIHSGTLKGLIAGPALLIAGKAFEKEGREELKKTLVNYEKTKIALKKLDVFKKEFTIIERELEDLIFKIENLLIDFNKLIEKMEEIVYEKTNWKEYENKEKEIIKLTLSYFQIIYKLFKIPLLTEKGQVRNEVKDLINKDELSNKLELIEDNLILKNNQKNKKININTAKIDELINLPNIGEIKARDIISFRKKSKIKNLNDMLNIKGIGEKTLEELKFFIEIK